MMTFKIPVEDSIKQLFILLMTSVILLACQIQLFIIAEGIAMIFSTVTLFSLLFVIAVSLAWLLRLLSLQTTHIYNSRCINFVWFSLVGMSCFALVNFGMALALVRQLNIIWTIGIVFTGYTFVTLIFVIIILYITDREEVIL